MEDVSNLSEWGAGLGARPREGKLPNFRQLIANRRKLSDPSASSDRQKLGIFCELSHKPMKDLMADGKSTFSYSGSGSNKNVETYI
jgi:hypothetical protein